MSFIYNAEVYYFAGVGVVAGAVTGAVAGAVSGAVGNAGAVVAFSTFTSLSVVADEPKVFVKITVLKAATNKKAKKPQVNFSNMSPVFCTPNICVELPPNSEDIPPPLGF